MKKYVFHYNYDCVNMEPEFLEPGEMTYHEHLIEEDGMICTISDEVDTSSCGKPCVEAYFDDGNELTVYLDELEEVV